jgi:hypothetical protein
MRDFKNRYSESDLPSLFHAHHAGILREPRAHALWSKLVSGRSVDSFVVLEATKKRGKVSGLCREHGMSSATFYKLLPQIIAARYQFSTEPDA